MKISLTRKSEEITFKVTPFKTVTELSKIFTKFCDIWGFNGYLFGGNEVEGWMKPKRSLEDVKAMLEKHGFEVSLA